MFKDEDINSLITSARKLANEITENKNRTFESSHYKQLHVEIDKLNDQIDIIRSNLGGPEEDEDSTITFIKMTLGGMQTTLKKIKNSTFISNLVNDQNTYLTFFKIKKGAGMVGGSRNEYNLKGLGITTNLNDLNADLNLLERLVDNSNNPPRP